MEVKKTIVIRLSNLDQWDKNKNEISYHDEDKKRGKIYVRANHGDSAIFVLSKDSGSGFVLAKIDEWNSQNKVLKCIEAELLKIKTDKFNRINAIEPEITGAQARKFFMPFWTKINIDEVKKAAKNNHYIHFYIVSESNRNKIPESSSHDRAIVLDDKDKVMRIDNYSANQPFSIGYSLEEIKNIRLSLLKKKRIVNRLFEEIGQAIKTTGYYEFQSFYDYYDNFINKSVNPSRLKSKEQSVDDVSNNGGIEEMTLGSDSKITLPLNLILYGPPGTGKTYNTLFKALEIIEGKTREDLDEEKNEQDEKWKKDTNNPKIEKKGYEVLKGRYDYCIKKGQIVFTTFHQSMSYEDFIEGIKPKVSNSKKQMTYEVQDGVFKQICDKAEKEQSANYVLIIDEINRGNVAQIFGELITLIEPNKRLGNSEEMKAILPYSSAQKGTSVYFGVPNNLYIIGTMNTADRSVEALDTALRRRFSFEEMMPKPELLKDKNPLEVCGVKLGDLLTTINARIVALKDREHQIGHSYFMGSENETNKEEWLKSVFKDKIIPLLQEYFYGDYKKIYYVLGPGFVKEKTDKTIFAIENPDYDEFDIPEERYDIVSFDATFNIKDAIVNMKVQKPDSGKGANSSGEEKTEMDATAESEESTGKE